MKQAGDLTFIVIVESNAMKQKVTRKFHKVFRVDSRISRPILKSGALFTCSLLVPIYKSPHTVFQ